MKEHITGGHENIRRMTNGMKKSIRMDKINITTYDIYDKRTHYKWTCQYKA
jgi:hypothetical protein